MNKKIIVLAAMVLTVVTVKAQTKTTTHYNQIWGAYFNQTRFSDKVGLWTDLQFRTKDYYVEDLSTTIARVGLTYYLNDVTKLTAGYGYITNYPADASTNVNQPEHRPWQQIQWHTKNAKTRLMQYIRLEERYRRKFETADKLAEGYSFNWRLRYNFLYEIPFNKAPNTPGRWSFIVNDELLINFGKQVVNNYFDQNRLFLGLKVNTNAHDNLQFGYLNQFIQLPAGNRYRNADVIRIAYFQNLDVRRKKVAE
ncbi:MAG: hypothetical protein JWQ96_245 [Segetibacter sp.]|nr:hypothetical protein [Segetibacter sp.]